MMKKTFKTAHAIRKKAIFRDEMSVHCKSRSISGHDGGGLTETCQELGISEAFCEIPGGGICCCGAVEGMQGCCDGGENRAWFVCVSCYMPMEA
jgi:hypothetical protein